jgi:deoxyribonuclease IV
MNNFHFGAHISIVNGYINAVDEVNKYGGNLIQIFITPPRSSKTKIKSDDEYNEFKKYLDMKKTIAVVHGSYLINIAKHWDKSSWWVQNILNELEIAHKFNAYGVVIHFGKTLELSQEEAFNNMFSLLVYILNETKKLKPLIIIEMTAGQGTETGYHLNDVIKLNDKLEKIKDETLKNKYGFCFDTCHGFASGINIKNKQILKDFFNQFNKKIGINKLKLIHLNDSKVNLGEKKDRHENIGKGYIGLEPLIHVFKFARKYKIPTVLETPNSGYIHEIPLLINHS